MSKTIFKSFDFENIKSSYTWEGKPFPDTNRLWYDWFEHLKAKGYPVEIFAKCEFVINTRNRTGILFNFGHYSQKNTLSAKCFGSKRTGKHNLTSAKRWADPLKVSTRLSDAYQAMTSFLSDPKKKGYRVAIILRNDNHTCSVFARYNRVVHKYEMALFNTLNTRFDHFDLFHSAVRKKSLFMYTKPGFEDAELCDILSFKEVEQFFEIELKLAFPFHYDKSLLAEYKPRKKKKENAAPTRKNID